MFWSVRRRHSRLGDQLQDLLSISMQRLPEKVRDALVGDAELVADAGEHALREGDTAPDFVLPDSKGQIIRLSSILEQGPVVLSFYRGGWCPYCNLEIRALQDVLPQISSLGAVLVAVSPEPPDNSMSMTHLTKMNFDVLSDLGNQVARAFNIVCTFGDDLRTIHEHFGFDLAEHNEDDSMELPIPATYVIDQERKIRFAFASSDYKQRVDPENVVAALRSLER